MSVIISLTEKEKGALIRSLINAPQLMDDPTLLLKIMTKLAKNAKINPNPDPELPAVAGTE